MRLNLPRLPFLCAALLSLAVFAGCDRRTPDERLATAVQFYQQGDAASAEMEALKVVENAPADPVGVQASLLLAQIYSQQNRLEEAEIQLKGVLEHVSQLDPMGVNALRMYLGSLTAQKKFDEALTTVDQYQQEYADDAGTSLSLRVVKADIQTAAGQTTAARQTLQSVMSETTGTAELALYRDLYVQTYYQDGDSTGALNYLQDQLSQLSDSQEQVPVLTTLAQISAANEDYEVSRRYLEQLTRVIMDDMRGDPEPLSRAGRALRLGEVYLSSDNLPGAERVFAALYDMNFEEPEAVQTIVNKLVETRVRLGETTAAQTVLEETAQKNPQGPYAQVLQQMKDLQAEGRFHQVAPQDTSTLVMKYRNDQNVLWPADLPQVLSGQAGEASAEDGQTTGTPAQAPSDVNAAASQTTGSAAVPASEAPTSTGTEELSGAAELSETQETSVPATPEATPATTPEATPAATPETTPAPEEAAEVSAPESNG